MNDHAKLSSAPSRKAENDFDLRESLAAITTLVHGIDQGQKAGLEATNLLVGEINTLQGMFTHLIEVLTPAQTDNDGPSLRDLLQQLIRQQRATAQTLDHLVPAIARIETRIGSAPTPAPPTRAAAAPPAPPVLPAPASPSTPPTAE